MQESAISSRVESELLFQSPNKNKSSTNEVITHYSSNSELNEVSISDFITPKWKHYNVDLDLASLIARAKKDQFVGLVKFTKTQDHNVVKLSKQNLSHFSIYLACILIRMFYDSYKNQYKDSDLYVRISYTEIVSTLFRFSQKSVNKANQNSIFMLKSIIHALTNLKLFNGESLLDCEKHNGVAPVIHLKRIFFEFANVKFNIEKHDFIPLNEHLWQVIEKYTKQSRVLVCLFEFIFLETKKYLEKNLNYRLIVIALKFQKTDINAFLNLTKSIL